MQTSTDSASIVFCARCAAELRTGVDSLFRVTIVAVADPSPPLFSADDMERNLRQEIRKLLAQLENMSEREAMDQVHRELTLHMCSKCYPEWIEDPTGDASSH